MSFTLQPRVDLEVPPGTLIAMVGPAGAGKSTWLAAQAPPQAIISSDHLREVICDDPSVQEANADVFRLQHELAAARLRRGHTAILDATHLTGASHTAVRTLAAATGAPLYWLIYATTEATAYERNAGRSRRVPEAIISRHWQQYVNTVRHLTTGHRANERVAVVGDATHLSLTRATHGLVRATAARVQVVGDIHGCIDEFRALLVQAGWRLEDEDEYGVPQHIVPPTPETILVSVGDLVDRGPDPIGVLRLMAALIRRGHARMVLGNHDERLLRALRPNNKVMRQHGLEETLEAFDALPAEEQARLQEWLTEQPLALCITVPDHPTLWVSHAGVPHDWLTRWPTEASRVRSRLLYGEVEGADLETGLPIRGNGWTAAYPAEGDVLACYGHTPHRGVDARGGTLNLDTAAPFGGALTLYDTATRGLCTVPSRATYAASLRPIGEGTPLRGTTPSR
jgi:predicted kinase